LFMLVDRGEPGAGAVGTFAAILLCLVVAAFAARILVVAAGADYCGKCRSLVPFERIAQALREAGFTGRGTVLVDDFHIGGNLRVQFPEARVVYTDAPKAVWPPPRGADSCLVVWPSDNPGARAELTAYLRTELGAPSDAAAIAGTVTTAMPRSERRYRIGYQLYPAGAGECR
jgi:hypothetical protein